MSNPLEVISVSKKFKQHLVLNQVSLTLGQGKIFGLLGLNGIGKTTLIKIMLGLLQQDGGEVKMFDLTSTDINAKRKLCYLPEKFMPSAYLKGSEFLKLSIIYYGIEYSPDHAIKLCYELGLSKEALDQKIGSYSKGMGQKLGLISVFMANAPLIILDEPMSGLDPKARIALKKKLLEYKSLGHAVFFSSHILSDVEEICDEIGVLHNGALIFHGNSAEFIEQYKGANLEISFLNAIGG